MNTQQPTVTTGYIKIFLSIVHIINCTTQLDFEKIINIFANVKARKQNVLY